METGWAEALRQLGKTMVIAQKAEDGRGETTSHGGQIGGEERGCLKAMLRLSWSLFLRGIG